MKFIKATVFVVLLVLLALAGRYFLLGQKQVSVDVVNNGQAGPTDTAMTFDTTTETSTSLSTTTETALTGKDHEQIMVLNEIFESKNDNDPRMDRLLRDFSEPTKAELRKKYASIRPENRNERGTIVFLIGRELSEGRGGTADLQFMKEALLEKPCLSLVDCSKSPSSETPEEQHLEAIHETTIHYPQLMCLRYFKQALENGNLSPVMREAVIAILEESTHSPNPRVASEATATLGSLKQK